MNISCIILAAGSSSRMTKYKQLLRYKGVTFIKLLTQIASSLDLQSIVCVTGFLKTEIEKELSGLDIEFLHNMSHTSGQTSSLKLALDHLIEKTDSALITLTDQPLIPLSHYQNLRDAARIDPSKLIATQYGDTFGVPAIIPSSYFAEFLQLQDNSSPKSILKKNQDDLILIRCDAAAKDIDTDEDYNQLLAL